MQCHRDVSWCNERVFELDKKLPQNENRIITLHEERSSHYSVEKVDLPLKESHLIQVARGEHQVALQMATVGSIGMVRNGFAVESIGINVVHPNYIAFVIPEFWTGDYLVNGESASESSFFMTGDLDSFHLHSKSRVTMGVTLPRQPYIETIAALTGVYLEDIKLHDRKFRLSEADSDTFKARLRALIDETCNTPERHRQIDISNTVIGLLADAYLRALPESRYQKGRTNSPAQIVRLAEEYFMAAPGKLITLADLCVAAGVGKTTLYQAFNDVCGLPPLAYFQKRRMMRARSLLVQTTVKRGMVKQAALSAGFTELGRFSVEYRQLFDESPSVTLGRFDL